MKRQLEGDIPPPSSSLCTISNYHSERLHREWLIFQIEPEFDRAMVRQYILKRLYDVVCEIEYIYPMKCAGPEYPKITKFPFNTCFMPLRILFDVLTPLGEGYHMKFSTTTDEEIRLYNRNGKFMVERLRRKLSGDYHMLFYSGDLKTQLPCIIDYVSFYMINELSLWSTRKVEKFKVHVNK